MPDVVQSNTPHPGGGNEASESSGERVGVDRQAEGSGEHEIVVGPLPESEMFFGLAEAVEG